MANRRVSVKPSPSTIRIAAFVVGAALMAGSFVMIALAEDRSGAVLLAIIALIMTRILYIDVPDWLERKEDGDERE